ncbi:pEP1242L [African swine fever virus]|uniref:PEP1242L n=1 Tax=African swine fever virus TaxID=10497 RepID=A0A8A1V4A5_ASF|nr:pEP1242L [African swine fever virus]
MRRLQYSWCKHGCIIIIGCPHFVLQYDGGATAIHHADIGLDITVHALVHGMSRVIHGRLATVSTDVRDAAIRVVVRFFYVGLHGALRRMHPMLHFSQTKTSVRSFAVQRLACVGIRGPIPCNGVSVIQHKFLQALVLRRSYADGRIKVLAGLAVVHFLASIAAYTFLRQSFCKKLHVITQECSAVSYHPLYGICYTNRGFYHLSVGHSGGMCVGVYNVVGLQSVLCAGHVCSGQGQRRNALVPAAGTHLVAYIAISFIPQAHVAEDLVIGSMGTHHSIHDGRLIEAVHVRPVDVFVMFVFFAPYFGHFSYVVVALFVHCSHGHKPIYKLFVFTTRLTIFGVYRVGLPKRLYIAFQFYLFFSVQGAGKAAPVNTGLRYNHRVLLFVPAVHHIRHNGIMPVGYVVLMCYGLYKRHFIVQLEEAVHIYTIWPATAIPAPRLPALVCFIRISRRLGTVCVRGHYGGKAQNGLGHVHVCATTRYIMFVFAYLDVGESDKTVFRLLGGIVLTDALRYEIFKCMRSGYNVFCHLCRISRILYERDFMFFPVFIAFFSGFCGLVPGLFVFFNIIIYNVQRAGQPADVQPKFYFVYHAIPVHGGMGMHNLALTAKHSIPLCKLKGIGAAADPFSVVIYTRYALSYNVLVGNIGYLLYGRICYKALFYRKYFSGGADIGSVGYLFTHAYFFTSIGGLGYADISRIRCVHATHHVSPFCLFGCVGGIMCIYRTQCCNGIYYIFSFQTLCTYSVYNGALSHHVGFISCNVTLFHTAIAIGGGVFCYSGRKCLDIVSLGVLLKGCLFTKFFVPIIVGCYHGCVTDTLTGLGERDPCAVHSLGAVPITVRGWKHIHIVKKYFMYMQAYKAQLSYTCICGLAHVWQQYFVYNTMLSFIYVLYRIFIAFVCRWVCDKFGNLLGYKLDIFFSVQLVLDRLQYGVYNMYGFFQNFYHAGIHKGVGFYIEYHLLNVAVIACHSKHAKDAIPRYAKFCELGAIVFNGIGAGGHVPYIILRAIFEGTSWLGDILAANVFIIPLLHGMVLDVQRVTADVFQKVYDPFPASGYTVPAGFITVFSYFFFCGFCYVLGMAAVAAPHVGKCGHLQRRNTCSFYLLSTIAVLRCYNILGGQIIRARIRKATQACLIGYYIYLVSLCILSMLRAFNVHICTVILDLYRFPKLIYFSMVALVFIRIIHVIHLFYNLRDSIVHTIVEAFVVISYQSGTVYCSGDTAQHISLCMLLIIHGFNGAVRYLRPQGF